MQVVSAGIFSLWSHSETLPVCRATPAMACGKRTTPVAAHITDEVMGTGPCLVGGAAAAVTSAEPEKGGGGHLQLRIAVPWLWALGAPAADRGAAAIALRFASLSPAGRQDRVEQQHVLVPGCA